MKPDFEVNNANARAVAEVCYRLEGIPLAIELAAARIRALTPQAILSRLSSRLKLLTGGGKERPSRQQTLRSTIDWSYDLLSEGEKQLLRRLSVFRGGRTLEAVEEVCAGTKDEGRKTKDEVEIRPSSFVLRPLEIDVLDGITSLVDKNLMYTVEDARGEPRYLMLETIYEYAWEKLREYGEAEELQRQHALYFMRLAEAAQAELKGANQEAWLARLEDEHDNQRAALHWASDTVRAGAETMEIGLRIGGAIWRFWYVRGYFSEGLEQLMRLLEMQSAQASPADQGEHTSQSQAQRSGTLGAARAKALNGAGTLAYFQGDYTSTRSLYEESLALLRELGDKSGIAGLLGNLGILAQEQGDYTSARSLQEESLALCRELGDKIGIAASLAGLGRAAVDSAGSLGQVASTGSDTPGEIERGARLLGAVEALLESIGAVLDVGDRLPYERAVASARVLLGEEEFERLRAEGRAMSMEQAIEYALERTS